MPHYTSKPSPTSRPVYAIWVRYADGKETLYRGALGQTWSEQCPESIKLMTALAKAANVHSVQWHLLDPRDAMSAKLPPNSIIQGVTA